MNSLLKCWGECIRRDGVETKAYLSYKIMKDNFKDLNVINCKLDLNKFDYAEITLNQITGKIVLEFNTYNNIDADEIVDMQWNAAEFFKVISKVESSK